MDEPVNPVNDNKENPAVLHIDQENAERHGRPYRLPNAGLPFRRGRHAEQSHSGQRHQRIHVKAQKRDAHHQAGNGEQRHKENRRGHFRFFGKNQQGGQEAYDHQDLGEQLAPVRSPDDPAHIVNKNRASQGIGLERDDFIHKIRHPVSQKHGFHHGGPVAEVIVFHKVGVFHQQQHRAEAGAHYRRRKFYPHPEFFRQQRQKSQHGQEQKQNAQGSDHDFSLSPLSAKTQFRWIR